MLSRTKYALGLALCVSLIMPQASVVLADANDRETPLVRAVANCRTAVVNLRGRKTVRDDESPISSDVKQVMRHAIHRSSGRGRKGMDNLGPRRNRRHRPRTCETPVQVTLV